MALCWHSDSQGMQWWCWPWMVGGGMTLQGLSIFLLNIYRSLSLSTSLCLSLKHRHICRHTHARMLGHHTHTHTHACIDVIRHANRQIYIKPRAHTRAPTHTWHCHAEPWWFLQVSTLSRIKQLIDGWMEGGLDTLSPLPLISFLIATN